MASYEGQPGLGTHFLQATEFANGANATFYGDNGTTDFRGALLFKGMF